MGRANNDVALRALEGLVSEFRRGNIVDLRAEREGIDRHTSSLMKQWDQRFPGFPREYFPFTSLVGQCLRGKRDAHLKRIVVRLLTARDRDSGIIVNPACVMGRHARDLASRLRCYRVIATDIDPRGHAFYERFLSNGTPPNHEFVQDSVFSPTLNVTPTAVVFFGACGAVSDGAMDYAVDSGAALLACRTCCHENIGGNTEIVPRCTAVNWFYRGKNWAFEWLQHKDKYNEFYFSDKYGPDRYPRSRAAAAVIQPSELRDVARNSTDSDICRAIIDLDRYLYLVERGYHVTYQGELFVAERVA